MGFTSSRMVQTRGTIMEDMLVARHALNTGDGIRATNKTAAGIPAFYAAAEFAAEAIAQLTMGVWSGPNRSAAVPDAWQAKLFDEGLLPDRFTFWHTAETSVEFRNIAYVWKSKSGARVVRLTALHPDQVTEHYEGTVRRFTVAFAANYPMPPEIDGFGSVDVGLDTLLVIRGRGGIGEHAPLTPVQMFAKTLGIAIAKQDREASLLNNGASGGLVVTFPLGTKKEEADQWRDDFDDRHAGASNFGRTKVVGGGATATEIGMTQADAQFVDSYQLSIQDIAMIQFVPVWLLLGGAKTRGAVSPEHEMQRWLTHYVGPRAARIESAFAADPDIFGAGSLRPGFYIFDVVRGDLATEDNIAHQRIQDGRLVPDEWRADHGLPALPGGVGKIPQITPVGGAPNSGAVPVTPPVQPGVDN